MKAWVRPSHAKGPLSIHRGALADAIKLRRSLQIGWQFYNRLDDTDVEYTAAQIMVLFSVQVLIFSLRDMVNARIIQFDKRFTDLQKEFKQLML